MFQVASAPKIKRQVVKVGKKTNPQLYRSKTSFLSIENRI